MKSTRASQLMESVADYHESRRNVVERSELGVRINLGIVGPYLTLVEVSNGADSGVLIRHESRMKLGWEDHPKFEKVWRKYAKLLLATDKIDLGYSFTGVNGPTLYMSFVFVSETTPVEAFIALENRMQELSHSLDVLFSRKLR